MNKKALMLMGSWCLMLVIFIISLGYYPISFYYDGYLTVLQNSVEELNYIFVPSYPTTEIKTSNHVKIRYFLRNQWQEIRVQVKWENNYYLILNQPELIINVWYLSAKLEFSYQTTLNYLLKIMF